MRTTSQAGLQALIQREGRRLKAYKDSVGVWTIGIGHTAAAGPPEPKAGLTLTKQEVDALFAKDIKQYERAVNSAVKIDLEQNEFDALVSFCYNVGPGNFKKSTLVKKLNAGDREGAIAEFDRWHSPPEVTGRRNQEKAQFAGRAKPTPPPRMPQISDGPTISPVPIAAPEGPKVPVVDLVPQGVAEVAAGHGLGWLGKVFGAEPPKSTPTYREMPEGGDPLIFKVQTQLITLGYAEVGEPDGKAGPKLRAAVELFRRDNDLPAGSVIDDDLLATLPKAKPRLVSEARANASVASLREAGNSGIKSLDAFSIFGKVLGAGGIIGGLDQTGALDAVKNTADSALGTLNSIKTLVTGLVGAIQWCLHHWWIFALAGGAYILYHVVMGMLKMVVLYRQGILQQASK